MVHTLNATNADYFANFVRERSYFFGRDVALRDNDLHIVRNTQCHLLFLYNWETIVIASNLCNYLEGELVINRYPNLIFINIGSHSLQRVYTFVLSSILFSLLFYRFTKVREYRYWRFLYDNYTNLLRIE